MTASPTRPSAQLLALASALMPEVAARARETETARTLPPDLAARLAQAGLFRTLLPRSLGGLECDPWTALTSMRLIGQADASAGWCVMIGATAALSAAWLDPAVARRIHDDPAVITGGVFAPMGRARREGDALVVDGRWAWFSGHRHCRWLAGGCLIMDGDSPRRLADGTPESRMVFFPAEAAESLDGWHVSGLSGTGSGEVAVRGLRVPYGQSVSLVDEAPHETGPLYRMPVFGLLAQGIAAVMLGNAWGALDELVALAGAKRPQGSRRSLAERGAAQSEVARARAALIAAEAGCQRAVDALWARLNDDDAESGGAGSAHADPADDTLLRLRADLRASATWATRTAADVVRALYDLGGGSSVFLDHPLQRRFRDAHVGTQHLMVAPPTYELAGRVLMGLDTDTRLL